MNFAKYALGLSLIGLFSMSVWSQTPTPTPPDTEGDVVKISTSLIQIDVTVTDKKGNVVTDLKPEDFEIYENGKKQEITNSSFVNLAAENDSLSVVEKNPKIKNQLPIPGIRLKPENVRRTYAIAVDDLGLSFASIYWIQQSLKKFINEQMQEGDLVAIIRTGGGIGALQSFTTDRRLLLAAVSKIRWNSQGRVGINSFEPIKERQDKGEKALKEEKALEEQISNFRSENSAVGTLGALNYIVRGIKDLPGRKAVILLSEGFKLTGPLNNSRNANPNIRTTTKVLDGMRLLADQANRSSVVFYTLDPRGLVAPGAQAMDAMVADKDNMFANDDALQDRERLLSESQSSLRYLAYETGGIPFVNQNNISAGFQKIIHDQKGYYLVAYQPNDETFDPKKNRFNKLTVNVKRPDLKIRYRSGFFGVSDERIAERANQSDPKLQLTNALISPFGASGIDIDVYSAFYQDKQDREFIRTFVYINPKDLSFTVGNDGLYKADFDIIVAIFDANGEAATNNINTHTLKFTKERLATLQEKGIIYDLPVPITKKGAYQFRVALRDKTTGKIGAASQFIEIPDLDKKRLTLSNLIIRNYPIAEWKKVSLEPNGILSSTNNHLIDTVKREFKKGSVMTYFSEIYNAKTVSNQSPQLLLQTKLFREGKMIIESSPSPIKTDGNMDLQRISIFNAITLGTDLQAGDYALQIIVYDKLANEKRQMAFQTIDFEITE